MDLQNLMQQWQDDEEEEYLALALNYSGDGIQLVLFRLEEETYGIDIHKVRELVSFKEKITPIPDMPPFIRGLLNLRGTIIPVMELRTRFKMPKGQYDKDSVIIIVQVGTKLIGLLVDRVSDVAFLGNDQIQSTPEFETDIHAKFLDGVGMIKETMVILLNVDRLLSQEELSILSGGV